MKKKDNITIISFDVIATILLFILVKTYSSAFFLTYIGLLVLTYILLLIFSFRKLISKFVITFHALFLVLNALVLFTLIKLNIFNDLIGLDALNVGFTIMLYYLLQSSLLGLLLITNFIKSWLFKEKLV